MENNDSIFSDIHPEETRASSIQVIFTRLIDFAVDICVVVLFYLLVPQDVLIAMVRKSSLVTPVIFITILTMYRLLLFLLFNRTIGMMLCRVKLLNGALSPLSPKEKFASLFRSWSSEIKYYKEK